MAPTNCWRQGNVYMEESSMATRRFRPSHKNTPATTPFRCDRWHQRHRLLQKWRQPRPCRLLPGGSRPDSTAKTLLSLMDHSPARCASSKARPLAEQRSSIVPSRCPISIIQLKPNKHIAPPDLRAINWAKSELSMDCILLYSKSPSPTVVRRRGSPRSS